MAEVDVAVQDSNDSGLAQTKKGALSAADTYMIPNDGKTVLQVINKGTEDTKVTIKTPAKSAGLDIAEREVTVVKETGEKIIGPFKKSVYNNADGEIEVTLSKVTSVTLSVIRVTPV